MIWFSELLFAVILTVEVILIHRSQLNLFLRGNINDAVATVKAIFD